MQNAATRYHKDIAALDKNTSHHKLAARGSRWNKRAGCRLRLR